ncbi:unnamed protein product [Vicia faba]|uniref:Uncharacterized protein n=1 Tax=Vicia faba TaxID=3906 RepID=A0AAV1A262_VICFA|nr:unnamed protein product [Vicia faba]
MKTYNNHYSTPISSSSLQNNNMSLHLESTSRNRTSQQLKKQTWVQHGKNQEKKKKKNKREGRNNIKVEGVSYRISSMSKTVSLPMSRGDKRTLYVFRFYSMADQK